MSQELWRQCAAWLKSARVIESNNACFDRGARVYDLALALQVRLERKKIQKKMSLLFGLNASVFGVRARVFLFLRLLC